MNQLANEQTRTLVDIVREVGRPCLNDDELTDRVLLLLENVAGFDAASERSVRRVLNDVRRYYDGTSSESEDE